MAASAWGSREGGRHRLEGWQRSTTMPAGLVQRARIVLLAAQGMPNTQIAVTVWVSRPTVISWRGRYERFGLGGLADAAGSGRPRTVDRAKNLTATLTPQPNRLGITHWSSRLLAAHLRTNHSSV